MAQRIREEGQKDQKEQGESAVEKQRAESRLILFGAEKVGGICCSVEYPGDRSAEDQGKAQPPDQPVVHSRSSSSSLRSSSSSSRVRPLSHRAAAKAGRLPRHTFWTKVRLWAAR